MSDRFQFDPVKAKAQAAEIADSRAIAQQKALDELDTELNLIGVEITDSVSKVFEGLRADDDKPADVQLTNGYKARDKLQTMLDRIKGASSATLPQAEQEVLTLIREGHLRIVPRQIDNPDKPGEVMTVQTVIDNRLSRRSRPVQPPATPSPVPVTTPPPSAQPISSPAPALAPQDPPAQPAAPGMLSTFTPLQTPESEQTPTPSSSSSDTNLTEDDGSEPDPATVPAPKAMWDPQPQPPTPKPEPEAKTNFGEKIVAPVQKFVQWASKK